MKTILTIISVIIAFTMQAQTLEELITDGSGETRIDTTSKLYKNAKMSGFELFSFSTSGCDDSYGNKAIPTKMIKKEFKKDTLTVTFEFSDACCISFTGDVEFNKNILNLMYSTYGEPCECRCYYTLEYKIKTSIEVNTILFNGNETVK